MREWEEQNAVLRELLAGIDHDGDGRDGLAPVSALLERVRECRRRLADPSDAGLRNLWHRALDEISEATCASLYGDLGPARQHADAALGYLRQMQEILRVWMG